MLLLVIIFGPVELGVIDYFGIVHHCFEECFEHVIIGFFIKLESSDVLEVLEELVGGCFAECFDWGVYFFEFDLFVLVLLVVGFEVHPGEGAVEEIE